MEEAGFKFSVMFEGNQVACFDSKTDALWFCAHLNKSAKKGLKEMADRGVAEGKQTPPSFYCIAWKGDEFHIVY